jgi:hypothetical protein
MRVCDDLAGAKSGWFTGKTMAAVSSHPLAATQKPSAAILDWPDSGECGSIASERQPDELPVAGVDPLYLFCCSVSWHRQADAGAGWELIEGLRAPGREARLVASALLARAADVRLPVRDLRQSSHGIEKTAAADSQKVDWHVIEKVVTMNTPYGLEIIESCVACKLRRGQMVLQPFPRGAEVIQRRQPSEHLPRRRCPFRRRPNAARRLRSLLGQGQALDNFSRRESTHSQNGHPGRGSGTECCDFGDML